MAVEQMRIRWGGLGHSPKYSILNYGLSNDQDLNAEAFNDFLTTIKFAFAGGMTWTFEKEIRVLSEADGHLIELQELANPPSGAQTGGTQQLADATQMLLQWRTGVIVSGRQLRGRTFLPGIAQSEIANGNVRESSRTAVQDALATLIGTGHAPAVWSRKHGTVAEAVSADVWNEFAVQRRRRG